MTRKSKKRHLPRLDTPEGHDHLRRKSPADLRGANYPKLHDQNKEDAKGQIVLRPILDNDEKHPLPYYVSDEVVLPPLKEPPWQADERKNVKRQLDRLSRDTRLQDTIVEEVISDTIQVEITEVASVTLSQSKYEEKTDRHAAGLLEEELLIPDIQHQVYLIVWGLLYEMSRALDHKEFMKLKEKEDQLIIEPVAKQALLSHVQEGEDWADDLTEEKILAEKSWDVLIFHYHKNLEENALSNNDALKILQERLIAEAVGGAVNTELIDLLGKELVALDENEKLASPPRKG